MNLSSTTTSTPDALPQVQPVVGARSRAERQLLAMLARLTHGTLDLQGPDGHVRQFRGSREPDAVRAAITVHDAKVYGQLLKSGDIGLAEAFFEGAWTSPDIPALLRLGLLNRQALEAAIFGSRLGSWLYRIVHLLRRNTKAGSRRNIHAHYDLGNRFYRLWLDGSMNYSSAWFDGNRSQPLRAAQEAKMARALAEAQVKPGSRVLEIGCGWGAVAEAAARQGAHLTGLTLSTEQLEFAQKRLAEAGLSQQVDLRLQDYRDVAATMVEPYDAIVSIEMFEAVGREYWASYFKTVKQCLAPEGRACIQTITIADEHFERYVRSTDFIQQYVFPGGLLPSPSIFRAEAKKAGLAVERELCFGTDYAHTLRLWRHAFLEQLPQVKVQGFDTRFVRLWEFYLAYCEAAFDAGSTDVMQFTLRHEG
jgi:cyclopropane-fatty-acyl-phospholipid synthase